MFSFLFGLMIKWLIHMLIVVGMGLHIVALVMGFMRSAKFFKLPVSILGSIALGVAIYFSGEQAQQKKIDAEAALLKAKLSQAEAQSAQVNTQIVTKVLTKTQVIHEKGQTIVTTIQQDAPILDKDCKVPPEAVALHNQAALITGDKK
jgi:hypothetical protein